MVTSNVFSTPVYEFSSHGYKRCIQLKSFRVYYKLAHMLKSIFIDIAGHG